uniref:NTR domain-containing protein n=1 Tax=Monopterus albus TaxID=43700 RepID=A0A3Q3ILA5_MONAL
YKTVLLQLFGFSEEVTAYVFLKTSMAPNHVVLAQEVVTLNAQNQHQAAAKVRVTEVNQHLSVAVSRTNGFLFIQTDKPLYTPHQSVKVRAFSMNQELRPANRSVFLTFKDPDHIAVDSVEMIDVNNGVPSMQNPFRIPIKPKLGIWTIEASYSDDFTTTATTDFEVKEYVLPSFSILVEPEANYISYGQFKYFSFKVSARYLHGAPVADAEVFLRYGYISGKNPPVIIPSVTRERVRNNIMGRETSAGMWTGPLFQTRAVKICYPCLSGGITQESEFAAVKFVKSPYSLSLVSTPPFIKPGLPYNIQVLVKDHLDKPVKRVEVRLVERPLFTEQGAKDDMPCTTSANSQSDGLAFFICNTPKGGVRAVLKFETVDPNLPVAAQASLTLEAKSYHSPNQRYLYIDPPLPGHGLQVGHYTNIKVYSATPSYVPLKALSYLVLSKGKVVDFGSRKFASSTDNKQTVSFEVMPSMVPSIRLLVYYILYGEGTNELVADSVWLDVRDKCVNGLQTDLSYRKRDYKPKQNLQMDIYTNQDGLVALSAVDTALFIHQLSNRKYGGLQVLRHIEHSDQGCGGGGGKDSADVFRLAGLTFITNANAQPSASSMSISQPFSHTCLLEVKMCLLRRDNRWPIGNGALPPLCVSLTGMCAAEPVQVSVSLPLSVNVPLPYQVVRGEQLELMGSVYNQLPHSIMVKIMGTTFNYVSHDAVPVTTGREGLRSTPCHWSQLSVDGVGKVNFTLLGLEPGEHTLTFTLKTQGGGRDVLEKKLRVVPEGVRKEQFSGGRLDPQGIYGMWRTVELKNKLLANVVPNTAVERMLSINGDVLGEVLSVMHSPEGLRQLINLPAGSAEAELDGLLPLVQVYQYLETARRWDILGADVRKNSADLRRRIREDASYSMWMKKDPSTWLTALVLKTLSAVDQVVSVDHQSLSESVAWLIYSTQLEDGSFTESSSLRANKFMVSSTSLCLRLRIALLRVRPQVWLNFLHAPGVKSVYVRAVATYALTLHDPNSKVVSQLLSSLEALARQKGHPAVLRYWQESSITADWLKPDQSSGLTVETTAYVLLTVLLKGRIPYAIPILSWLTQDQHYGEGFYSPQDTVLTLEAVTAYSRVIPRAVLSQDINIRYNRKGPLGRVQLSQSRHVATPIQVLKNDDIIVSTGYGTGVSNVKMKTVYYETTSSTEKCNFELSIEMFSANASNTSCLRSAQKITRILCVCCRYKPPPNEVYTESTLTVMKIQLPTGVEAYLEDLKQVNQKFKCFSFPVRDCGSTIFVTGFSRCVFCMLSTSCFILCFYSVLPCSAAACAAYRGTVDLTLTPARRTEETCKPDIKYGERDLMSAAELEAVSSGTEVVLVKKATCNAVNIHKDKQYLVMGASGTEVVRSHKYRLPLDSEAVVELWPTDCSSTECSDYISQLEEFALELQLTRCPDST